MDLEYVTYVREFFLKTVKPYIQRGEYQEAASLMRSINSQAVLDEKNTDNLLVDHAESFAISVQSLYNQLKMDIPHSEIIWDCAREFEIYSGQLKMRLEALAEE